jgi:hypothetical protein
MAVSKGIGVAGGGGKGGAGKGASSRGAQKVNRDWQRRTPAEWLTDNRHIISQALFLIWLAGMCYWAYKFYKADVSPTYNWSLFQGEEREFVARTALSYVFFGLTSGALLVGMLIYVIKFIVNIARGMVEGVFPHSLHYFVSSVAMLISLWPAFAYLQDVKGVYLSAINVTAEVYAEAKGLEVGVKVGALGSMNKEVEELSGGANNNETGGQNIDELAHRAEVMDEKDK